MSRMSDTIRALLQSARGHNNIRQEEDVILSMFNTMGLHSVGWARWHDTATAVTPIDLGTDTWTKITNDGLGAKSRPSEFLPAGVNGLFNEATSQADFSDLEIGSFVFWDFSLQVTTSGNNAVVQSRASYAIGTGEAFQVALNPPTQVKNAGTYGMGGFAVTCLCHEDTVNAPAEFQLKSDLAGTDVEVEFFHAVVFAA